MGSERVLVAGETLCDFFPEDESGLGGTTFSWRPGGAPANVAVALSRLDQSPLFWTRVGADPFGSRLVDTLRDAGVSTELVERDGAEHTTVAFVDTEAEDFLFYRGADRQLTTTGAPIDRLDGIDWVVIGGVSLSAEPARTAISSLLEGAQAAGCTVLFDPNARPELWGTDDFATVIGDRIPNVDVMCVTRDELESLTPAGETLGDQVDAIHARGPHTVCVTEGAAGARLFATDTAAWGPASEFHEGFDVHARDAVGAGDAFNAGFLSAALEGETDPTQLLERANAVAALATTAVGAMAALPDRESVMTFLS